MTYVTEQSSSELRAHMRRLKAMHGWNEPLADRLYKEVIEQDEEIEKLKLALTAPVATEQAQAVAEDLRGVWLTAPKRVWLDLGEPDVRNMDAYTVANFRDIGEVTWSEDNASGWGIPYVRSDLTSSPEAAPAAMQADKDAKTWAAYVAGIVETYLNGSPSPEVREKAIAGIIERRLWALPAASPEAAPAAIEGTEAKDRRWLCDRIGHLVLECESWKAKFNSIASRPTSVGEWGIDHSAGRPILVHKECSVIEAEDAEYVLGLINADCARAAGIHSPSLASDTNAIPSGGRDL